MGAEAGASARVPAGWEGILDPGEVILWQGQPQARFDWTQLFNSRSAFGFIFAGFSVFWMVAAWGTTRIGLSLVPDASFMAFLMPLFGLPFLLLGLNMAFGPQLMAWARRKGSWYTLTDRHAFIAVELLGKRSLERYPLGPQMHPALEEGFPGSVWFATAGPETGLGHRWGGVMSLPSFDGLNRIGFEAIPEARTVYFMLLEALAQRRAPPKAPQDP